MRLALESSHTQGIHARDHAALPERGNKQIYDNAGQGDGRSGKRRRGVMGACPLSPHFITPGKVVLRFARPHGHTDSGCPLLM